MQDQPPYIPNKFREDTEKVISSQTEVAIYNKLETQRVQAEMEVLEIRANNNQTKIKEIDDEIFQLFESKVEDNEAVQNLKDTWMGHVTNDQNTVCNKWKKRIKDQKNIFKNEKSNKSAAVRFNSSSQRTRNVRSPATTTNNNNTNSNSVMESPQRSQQQPRHMQPQNSVRPREQHATSQANPNDRPSVRLRQPLQTSQPYSVQNQPPKNYFSHQQPQPPRLLLRNSSTYPPSPWLRLAPSLFRQSKKLEKGKLGKGKAK